MTDPTNMNESRGLAGVAERLRRAGATLPAPQVTGTIEGAVVSGLCIALALVEVEQERIAKGEQAPAGGAATELAWIRQFFAAESDGVTIINANGVQILAWMARVDAMLAAAPLAGEGDGGMAQAMLRLSRALGHPATVQADDGQCVDAALIELAAQRLAAPSTPPTAPAPVEDAFWLYELTKGEGVYQGVRGPDAERIMRQVVSGIEEAGEPFRVPAAPDGEARDAARLDFLDQTNARFRMGWKVGKAPAGNVSVQSVIHATGRVIGIREAIDAAMVGGSK